MIDAKTLSIIYSRCGLQINELEAEKMYIAYLYSFENFQ